MLAGMDTTVNSTFAERCSLVVPVVFRKASGH